MDGQSKNRGSLIHGGAGATTSSSSGETVFHPSGAKGKEMAEVESGHQQMPILADAKSAKTKLQMGISDPPPQGAQPRSLLGPPQHSLPISPSAKLVAVPRGYQMSILGDVQSTKIAAQMEISTSTPVSGQTPAPLSSTCASPMESLPNATSSRACSHDETSTSPRCAFAWIAKCGLSRTCQASQHSIPVPRSQIKHVLGRHGRVLSQIEDLTGCLVSVEDTTGEDAVVRLMGGDAVLGCFLIHALSAGFYNVFATLQRNGISHTQSEWLSR